MSPLSKVTQLVQGQSELEVGSLKPVRYGHLTSFLVKMSCNLSVPFKRKKWGVNEGIEVVF